LASGIEFTAEMPLELDMEEPLLVLQLLLLALLVCSIPACPKAAGDESDL
jgi:hypothetical protein